ncbi:metallophosphoesterase, partial [Acinetobacter sp. 163]|nr:metallophosphoesterase [Acinetobacter sp. 163]
MYAFFVVMGILCIFAAGKTKISMKYLIVSDIHGSLPALEKVLAFYEREHCDMLCLLGDVLNYGPRNGLPE